MASKVKGGRPPKFTEPQIDELVRKFDEYIEQTDIPIVCQFAYQNGLNKQYLYSRPELSDCIKRCMTKKEYVLELGALTGTLNSTMAIFSLKANHHWKDRHETVVYVDPKTLSDKELSQLVGDEVMEVTDEEIVQ